MMHMRLDERGASQMEAQMGVGSCGWSRIAGSRISEEAANELSPLHQACHIHPHFRTKQIIIPPSSS